jgi:hypothetical protein
MKSKFFFGICLVIVVGISTLIGSLKALSQANKGQQWKDPTSLRARVEKEKAKGLRKVVFPAPIVEYADNISLETAIAETTIVVADVLDKQSRLLDPGTIATFYRLRVIETLSEPISSKCCNPTDNEFPKDLPVLGENEMYFVGMGGTIHLEDVEVTVKEDFEELQVNRRYLLFLSTTQSGMFSVGKVGPRGVFTVAGDGHLDSALKRFRLGRELETKFGNSLSRLKGEIVRLRKTDR